MNVLGLFIWFDYRIHGWYRGSIYIDGKEEEIRGLNIFIGSGKTISGV